MHLVFVSIIRCDSFLVLFHTLWTSSQNFWIQVGGGFENGNSLNHKRLASLRMHGMGKES